MPEAFLWEVVAVSCGCTTTKGIEAALGFRECANKFRIAEASRDKELPVVSWPTKTQNYDSAYTIIRLTEFASFAKRKGWTLPPRFPVDPVDWEKWARMDAAPLWQAILLSLGRSPDVTFENLEEPFRDPYVSVRSVAISSLGRGLRIHRRPDPDDLFAVLSPEERTWVLLVEFREWAEGKGYSLPERFPRVPRPKEATPERTIPVTHPMAKTSASKTEKLAEGGGETVSLPHTTEALRSIFTVMREHWTTYDPKNPPKQTVVAQALDKAVGWNPIKDRPSRNADVVAAVIRPDSVSDDDPRGRRRKPGRK